MNGWLTRLLFAAFALALLGWALSPLWLALLLSVLFYLLLSPLVGTLQARGVSHTRAIALSLAPALVLLVYAAVYSINNVLAYLPQLSADMEFLQQSATRALAQLEQHLGEAFGLRLQLADKLGAINLNDWLQTDKLLASTGTIMNIAINVALVPPLAFFLLRDYRQWRDNLLNLLPNRHVELGWLMYHGVSTRMQAYLRGLVWQAIILAAITSTGFWLAGFPSPLLLGVLTGIAGLVPYLGPFLAMIAPLVLLLSQPAFDPGTLWHLLLVLAVGFGFDNLVTVPFLLAGTVNLHPAVAMAAVLVAGHVGGIPAMILVIPLLGMCKIIVQTLVNGLGSSATHASLQQT
ncbi:MAG: AI-2E family transporter [Alcanivoracaceae bacterium]|nr:AI-2E family transporter [Alcanivoracaceae bacterium]